MDQSSDSRHRHGFGHEHPPPGSNPLAVAALVTGLAGLNLVAVAIGIAALVQIRRTGARGKGKAIGGIVAGATWFVVSLVALLTLAVADLPGNMSSTLTAQLFPKPGQCFDITAGDEYPIKDCDRPHDAEMILTFDLPDREWPGEQKVSQLGERGCEQRLFARYKTRVPVPNATSYVFSPRRGAWAVGDRRVLCGISADEGHKLDAPIGPGPSRTRALDELRPGDCMAVPGRRATTTRLIECGKPHDAQVTHRFKLRAGTYPGDKKVVKKAKAGCNKRWDSMFDRNPSPVRIEEWYWHPTRESWRTGDRLVVCYVTGVDGTELSRSVVPD